MSHIKKKRKVIRSEGRAMIAKVFHFLKEEYKFMMATNNDNCDLSPLANVLTRTAEATGVSDRTVSKILKEEKEMLSPSAKFPLPTKKRRITKKNKTSVDDKLHKRISAAVPAEKSVTIKTEICEENCLQEMSLENRIEVKEEPSCVSDVDDLPTYHKDVKDELELTIEPVRLQKRVSMSTEKSQYSSS